MIRKISVQDIVAKRAGSNSSDTNRHERDYLIERLTRKHTPPPPPPKPVGKIKKHHPKKSRSGHKWFWAGIIIFVALLVFVVMQNMVSATVSVTPKQLTLSIDTRLVASVSATTSPNTLTYQIITINAVDSQAVSATGSVMAKASKASGQITIFNNYSGASQTLIKNTRFETLDGLIYRIQNTISVPGYTTSNGKTVAGSITVTVVADQTGSKYNIDMTDFTVPGFSADSARYAKIFGRSKTTMAGGTDASSFGISATDRQKAQDVIEGRLRDDLLHQVQSQKTANSIIFDTASKISFKHLADAAGVDTKHAVIREQGTISSVVFDKSMLGKVLLGKSIADVGGSAEVTGLNSLHFIAAVSSTTPLWQIKPLTFTLSGQITATGVVDTDKLLRDLLGIPRSDLSKVLTNYPTIDKATVSVQPFWRGSFPNDASKIRVEIIK